MIPGRTVLRVLAWLCVALLFAFLVGEIEARGRGGGGRGGGGGRSMSRGGMASHGSMHGSRSPSRSYGSSSRSRPSSSYSHQTGRTRPIAQPSTRPATQPAASQRPSAGTRPASRPGDRPGTGQRPEQRPGEGNRDREDWQEHRDEAREDWQQHLEDQQQDRQQYYNNVREDIEEEGGYWGYGGVWVGDWDEVHVISIDDDDEEADWALLVAGWAIGTAITASTFSAATTKAACTLEEIVVAGVTYFRCGSTWYSRAMQSGEVRYIVVAPPPGY